jgi:hypothetical protein
MVKHLVLGARRGDARERVSLLVVGFRVARNWLQTWFDRGPALFVTNRKRFSCEISLETGVYRSSSYPTRAIPRHVAARRIHALHQLTGADNADTDARRTDAGRSHQTRHPDTGHRTRTRGHRTRGHRTRGHRTRGHPTRGRWTLDTYRTPDTGQADAGHADAHAGRGQGDQGTVGIRTYGYQDTAGTANRVAVGGTHGARR